jgi:eukaryotic-like serine/threonine-protein kinase
MSPEQVRGDPADHRSDLFSFGVLLYETMSGRRAFHGDTPTDTLSAILHDDPPGLSAIAPTISPAIERIVQRCLEKSPDERFQSARDVSFALEALSTISTTPTVTVPVTRKRNRERLAWIVAVTALAICAVTAVTLWLSLREKRQESAADRMARFFIWPRERTRFATTETAAETPQLAVSPDGRYVVFAAGERGVRPRLWLRALDSLALQELPGTEDASFPFWSPDSKYIAFFTPGKLKKVAAIGEPPQTLCDVPTGRGGTWSRGGTIIFASNIGDGLYRVERREGLLLR